jgi:teichuronic acid biosynthesis glycosyltransferase TuaC
MKVLFVSSGKSGSVNALIKNQGVSLMKKGVDVHYFIIKSGIRGYVAGILDLRKMIKSGKYNLIHAHYSLSAFAATLAGKMPIVVSLMGSDAYKSIYHRWIIKFFHYCRWNTTIVKTEQMLKKLTIPNAEIIPNGVDIDRFKPISKSIARKKIGYPLNKKLIIFVSDPARHEKNYNLALKAFNLLKENNTELLPVFNVPNESIPYYMNAADVLLLTSKREGSVNVIKEAMACNIPVVSTDVGDVKNTTSGVRGCYVSNPDPAALAENLSKAISHNGNSEGRKRIIELKLDSESIADRILHIYEHALEE